MDWLSELGKDNKMIVFEHKQKNGKTKRYHKGTLNVREYKQQYYLNNIDKYTERNRKASQERTLARLGALSCNEMVDAIQKKLED
jgi:hypothetical protein